MRPCLYFEPWERVWIKWDPNDIGNDKLRDTYFVTLSYDPVDALENAMRGAEGCVCFGSLATVLNNLIQWWIMTTPLRPTTHTYASNLPGDHRVDHN